MKHALVILLLFLGVSVQAQGSSQDSVELVQLTGVVMNQDSLAPVPFAQVLIVGKRRGTICDYNGYFSIAIEKTDTVRFSAMGMKHERLVLPDTLEDDRYAVVQLMSAQPIELESAYIFPWPSREQFADAFVNLDIPADEVEMARQNLQGEALFQFAQYIGNDGQMNFNQLVTRDHRSQLTRNQYSTFGITNPIAWAQFLDAWKKGAFKSKK